MTSRGRARADIDIESQKKEFSEFIEKFYNSNTKDVQNYILKGDPEFVYNYFPNWKELLKKDGLLVIQDFQKKKNNQKFNSQTVAKAAKARKVPTREEPTRKALTSEAPTVSQFFEKSILEVNSSPLVYSIPLSQNNYGQLQQANLDNLNVYFTEVNVSENGQNKRTKCYDLVKLPLYLGPVRLLIEQKLHAESNKYYSLVHAFNDALQYNNWGGDYQSICQEYYNRFNLNNNIDRRFVPIDEINLTSGSVQRSAIEQYFHPELIVEDINWIEETFTCLSNGYTNKYTRVNANLNLIVCFYDDE